MSDEPVAELKPVDRVGDTARITQALRLAVREALWQHKIAGNPVAVWRNGRVEWIPPEEIPVENPRGSLVEAAATGALKPWREVVTPHEDVASGRYQQAEFAADLWQVYLGEGSAEYREPAEFFRRTFLTESLRSLLVGAVQRVAGQGGDPVVQLQTNFGGGKTHSMLALYPCSRGSLRASWPAWTACWPRRASRSCRRSGASC